MYIYIYIYICLYAAHTNPATQNSNFQSRFTLKFTASLTHTHTHTHTHRQRPTNIDACMHRQGFKKKEKASTCAHNRRKKKFPARFHRCLAGLVAGALAGFFAGTLPVSTAAVRQSDLRLRSLM